MCRFGVYPNLMSGGTAIGVKMTRLTLLLDTSR